jgi:uncharacterized repeat protein (TIGR01451 family)
MRQIAVIPPNGVTFMNYRGHGSIQDWGSGTLAILANSDTGWWYPTVGEPHPLVLISMDCLDGNFAYPGVAGLGEAFHKLDGAGTVAHWASTGLGLTSDHTAMATGFYKALFEQGQLTIGAAINSGKIAYEQGNWNDYELYGFTLQGDPAMLLMRPDLELNKSPNQPFAEPGDTVSFEIQVGNDGLFDSAPTVVDTLPAGLTFVEATADREMTLSQNGNLITMDFAAPLGRNEGLTIQITTTIDIGFSGSGITNSAAVSGLALDVPGNNSDTATILMGDSAPVYLPVLMKP